MMKRMGQTRARVTVLTCALVVSLALVAISVTQDDVVRVLLRITGVVLVPLAGLVHSFWLWRRERHTTRRDW